MIKNLEKDINEGSESIRNKHFKYLESCFNDVQHQNQLRDRHQQNLMSIIDDHIANDPIKHEDKETTIKRLTEDFEEDFLSVLVSYRLKRKQLISVHKKALENAK